MLEVLPAKPKQSDESIPLPAATAALLLLLLLLINCSRYLLLPTTTTTTTRTTAFVIPDPAEQPVKFLALSCLPLDFTEPHDLPSRRGAIPSTFSCEAEERGSGGLRATWCRHMYKARVWEVLVAISLYSYTHIESRGSQHQLPHPCCFVKCMVLSVHKVRVLSTACI